MALLSSYPHNAMQPTLVQSSYAVAALCLSITSCCSVKMAAVIKLVTARVSREDVYVLPCVCVYGSVRVPKADNFITTSHFAFTCGGGLDPFRHVRLSV